MLSGELHQILGYAQPWIVSPGDPIDIKISSTEKSYAYRTVRLVQSFCDGAPLPRDEEVAEIPRGRRNDGRFQDACPGSYGIVKTWADVKLTAQNGIFVEFYFQPYLVDKIVPQVIVSCLDCGSNTGFAVVLQGQRLQFYVGTGSCIETFDSKVAINRWRWLNVKVAMLGKTVTTDVHQLNRLAEKTPSAELGATRRLSESLNLGSNTLLFGAGMFSGVDKPCTKPSSFFNGRIDSPSFAVINNNEQMLRTTIAKYDFAIDISSDMIHDVSGNSRNGALINSPTRGVKGYNWDGTQPDWTKASYGYGAIHFHEDDLDDAKFDTNFVLTIPETARSGAYAVDVQTESGAKDMITFFVRPNPKSIAPIALVLSTFTYLAYANERMYDISRSSAMATSDGVSVAADHEYYKALDSRPDLGLSAYDVHKDGSPNAFSSSLRPILNLRPGYVHWALDRPREFSADLLMIGFLERSGIPYDTITDHDLHFKGKSIANQYTTLITSCHPEYHSVKTLDAFSGFAKDGGNLMYLGGNGFYWVADVDKIMPYRLEVRKGDQGCRSVTFPAGERMHSMTGEQGGLWRSRGRAPNYLFGVGSCAFGTGKGKPYRLNAEYAKDPAYSWIFKGINPEDRLGVHGFGGGASGDEIDRLDTSLGTPVNTILLATSERHDDSFGLFNEESMFPMVDTLGSTCDRVRSDITYYETAAGGGVFSVGSINWYSSLAWGNYSNDVARMTENVIREFLERGRGARK